MIPVHDISYRTPVRTMRFSWISTVGSRLCSSGVSDEFRPLRLLASRLSSFVMVLTLPSTGSCGHRAAEDGRWGAAAQAIAAMRPLVVVELQEAIEGALERAPAGEVVSPKRDAPVLVQDRFL